MGFSSRWQELKPKGTPKGEPELILVKIQEFEQSLEQFKEEAAGIDKVNSCSSCFVGRGGGVVVDRPMAVLWSGAI